MHSKLTYPQTHNVTGIRLIITLMLTGMCSNSVLCLHGCIAMFYILLKILCFSALALYLTRYLVTTVTVYNAVRELVL